MKDFESGIRIITGTRQRQNRAHAAFLSARQTGLRQLSDLIKLQISTSRFGEVSPFPSKKPSALFDRDDLEELGFGSMVKVFGHEFQVYAGRRVPRIPNGDLLLMSRVIAINGKRGQPNQPARIVTEFDVPEQAWYFPGGSGQRVLPGFACMEAALQPCGFLSAYLGASLVYPEVDFYFRNLDGKSETLSHPQVGGQTITAQAELLSTTVSAGLIVQKFAFALSYRATVFFRGESTFGYFPPGMMEKQVGLDGGPSTSIGSEEEGNLDGGRAVGSGLSHLSDQMHFIQNIGWNKTGGKHGKGLIFASKEISPQDWFYRCHFFQDPVMPGSLGVEAVLQALAVYALQSGLAKEEQATGIAPALNLPVVWKYRGQFAPTNRVLRLRIDIQNEGSSANGIILGGDASVWADSIRIYEIKGITVGIA